MRLLFSLLCSLLGSSLDFWVSVVLFPSLLCSLLDSDSSVDLWLWLICNGVCCYNFIFLLSCYSLSQFLSSSYIGIFFAVSAGNQFTALCCHLWMVWRKFYCYTAHGGQTIVLIHGLSNFLTPPSEQGEKVSESKVPLVLLTKKASFHAFEGVQNLLHPYTWGHWPMIVNTCRLALTRINRSFN